MKHVICLMGPTASGKTGTALRLADTFACDIVSVDSALVYRGMNIGTAKPDAGTLSKYPHALVDIREPEEPYSAGEFVRDARARIDAAHEAGRLPLLVGGTMMYFRSLVSGIADLPDADEAMRAEIDAEAREAGWPGMHEILRTIDPVAASRINPNDSQRIQRALEVYRLSGRKLSDWQQHTSGGADYDFVKFALIPEPRATLHERIERRLDQMIASGFVDEVRALRERPELSKSASSMRAVGYRQYWGMLAGDYGAGEARSRALAATRQLAKRQLTWLRSEPDLVAINPLEVDAFEAISGQLRAILRMDKN